MPPLQCCRGSCHRAAEIRERRKTCCRSAPWSLISGGVWAIRVWPVDGSNPSSQTRHCMSDTEPVGLVLGSLDATPLEFWVGVGEGRRLQLDDLVVVETTLPGGDQVKY